MSEGPDEADFATTQKINELLKWMWMWWFILKIHPPPPTERMI